MLLLDTVHGLSMATWCILVKQYPCRLKTFDPVRSLSLPHSFSQMHFTDSPGNAGSRHTRSKWLCSFPRI
jgi:hypothetical protein